MGQDIHAWWNADWTSTCTAASQACTSAGISGELYQWGECEQLEGFLHKACVVWAKQMQVDCNGVAGCPSNNLASWKVWAWTTARDVAEEHWSQVAQWLSAQPIWLKCPGGLMLTHFRPPEKPFSLQERSHLHVSPQALPSLDTLHYADCQGGGKNSSVDEEKADFSFAAPRRDGTGAKWETMSKICCGSTAPCSISHQDLYSSLCCC